MAESSIQRLVFALLVEEVLAWVDVTGFRRYQVVHLWPLIAVQLVTLQAHLFPEHV